MHIPPFLACLVHPSTEHRRRACFLIGNVVLLALTSVDFLVLLFCGAGSEGGGRTGGHTLFAVIVVDSS